MARWWVSLCVVVLLVGCSPGGEPTFASIDRVVAAELGERAITLQQLNLSNGERIVLFRTAENPTITASLFVLSATNKWRLSGTINRAPLTQQGPISFRRLNQGQADDGNELEAKYHVIFGEVSDPSITWLEITLDDGEAKPARANVVNGTWLIVIPAGIGVEWTAFDLRAGGPGREIYTADNLKV